MFTDEELKEAQKQSQKSEVVKKLLEFYSECNKDGVQKLSVSLNKKLVVFAGQIDNADLDITSKDDEIVERVVDMMEKLGKIAQSLKAISGSDLEKVLVKRNKEHEHKVIL